MFKSIKLTFQKMKSERQGSQNLEGFSHTFQTILIAPGAKAKEAVFRQPLYRIMRVLKY